MHFLSHFAKKNLNYELINKFNYKNTKKIPKLKKIILNFGCKTTDIKSLISSLLALELITYQKSKFTITKFSNIVLKLRKGNPVGCKIELRNKKMYYFIDTILSNIFPKIKNFIGFPFNKNSKYNSFSFKIKDNFVFKPIEEHYYLFNSLTKLDITILVTNQKKTNELNFLLKSFHFPLKK